MKVIGSWYFVVVLFFFLFILVKKDSKAWLAHTLLFMESGISFARLFISKPKQRKISIEANTLFPSPGLLGLPLAQRCTDSTLKAYLTTSWICLEAFSSPWGKNFSKSHDWSSWMVFLSNCNFFCYLLLVGGGTCSAYTHVEVREQLHMGFRSYQTPLPTHWLSNALSYQISKFWFILRSTI